MVRHFIAVRSYMPLPVILDTDIGFDVDDVWALAFLLKCPELDVKLVTTNTGDTEYSAALVGKLLEVAGRTDIPIGIGIPIDAVGRTHSAWLGSYRVTDYRGKIHVDGVGAIAETIKAAEDPVTIICIGPLSNIAAALTRAPEITQNSRFIGMHGSIRKGYNGIDKPMKEYNVLKHTASCQKVFSTPWDISITPLDTCGIVCLQNENFETFKSSRNPLAQAVMENHVGWIEAVRHWKGMEEFDAQEKSSILFDTVAVYMAFSEDLLEMETLPIKVTDGAMTIIDDSGQKVRCAMNWKDLAAFESMLAQRLSG